MLQAIIFQGKNNSVGFARQLCRGMCSQCSCGSYVYDVFHTVLFVALE